MPDGPRDWNAFVRERLDLPEMDGGRDARIVAELADHLDDVYKEALAGGKSDAEAVAQVERRLGDADLAVHELVRSQSDPARLRSALGRTLNRTDAGLRDRGGRWIPLADLLRDLRTAVRGLARRPLFTLVVVLVLSLGIGATAIIATLVHTIVLSPLPFPEADRLVVPSHQLPQLGIDDAGQCAAWHFTYEDENRVFADLGMYIWGQAAITGGDEPEAIPVMRATAGVFRTIGMEPVLGRRFLPEDEDVGAPATMLLGYGYWQARFGGDADVLGRTMVVDGEVREIVGVMPATLDVLGAPSSIVVPLRYVRSEVFVGNIGFQGVARLADGVTVDEAVSDMTRMVPMAFERFPGGISARASGPVLPGLTFMKDDLVGSVTEMLWVLLAATGVVLLIACANVANLFLVRAEGQQTEMAIRTAMGAGGGRIGWEFLKESLLLAALGGVGGVVLASLGLDLIRTVGPVELPRLAEVTLGSEVMLLMFAVSLGVGLVLGLLPLVRHRRHGLVDALKQGGLRGGVGAGREHHRVQHGLVVGQMALALVLLVATGLMLRSFQALAAVDQGFHDPDDVLALRLDIPATVIEDGAEVAETHERIARRLAEIPGVTSVGLATAIPMDGSNNVNPFFVETMSATARDEPPLRRHKWLGAGYLETLKIPLVTGRTLTWDDVHTRAPVALVSESLARTIWGSAEAAMGQRIAARPEPPVWKEIVGVVANVRDDGVDQEPPRMVYWPQVTLGFWQESEADAVQVWRAMGYAIRSDRIGTTGFAREVERAVWSVNPNLPVRGLRTLPDLMAESVARRSLAMILLGIAAAVALVLGIVGVYGVISYAVSQRGRELGLRMALGAEASDLKKMVLGQGLLLSGLGVVIGLGLAVVAMRAMAGLLYGVSPIDPLTFLAVAAGLTVVALVASYLPARRAARVDPMEALRAE